MKTKEKFEEKNLDQQVTWLNDFLSQFLDSRPEIKQAILGHFKNCQANDYDGGIKMFNLQRWCGGDVNPTLEIAEVNGKLKFATTHYGVLAPLNRTDCGMKPIKNALIDFFLHPDKYLKDITQKALN
ncbi:MAG: hypothetical protein Q8Q67_01935 [bacterium]|nr:hypothetical protein [bacterium]